MDKHSKNYYYKYKLILDILVADMSYFKDQQDLLRSFLSDKIILISIIFSLAINFVLWAFLAFRFGSFPPVMALHYTIYFGIDLLGPSYRIFSLPLIGLVVIVVNFFTGHFVYQKEKLASHFLAVGAGLTQFLLLIAGIAVVFIIYNYE